MINIHPASCPVPIKFVLQLSIHTRSSWFHPRYSNTSECSLWPGIWDGGCCCGWGPGRATWGGHPSDWTQHSHKHQSGGNSYASRDHNWCSSSLSSAWMSSWASWGRRPASWSSSRRSWAGPWRPPPSCSCWTRDHGMLTMWCGVSPVSDHKDVVTAAQWPALNRSLSVVATNILCVRSWGEDSQTMQLRWFHNISLFS